MSEFLAMSGDGAYVWTAYGLSLAALVAAGAWPLLGMRNLVRALKRRRHAYPRPGEPVVS